MNSFQVVILLVVAVQVFSQGPSKETFLAVRRGMAQDCKESLGATDADVEHVINAIEPVSRMQKCLAYCILKQIGVLDGRKLNKEGFASVAKLIIFLDKNKTQYVGQVADECDKTDNDDLCELGGEMLVCLNMGLTKRRIVL